MTSEQSVEPGEADPDTDHEAPVTRIGATYLLGPVPHHAPGPARLPPADRGPRERPPDRPGDLREQPPVVHRLHRHPGRRPASRALPREVELLRGHGLEGLGITRRSSGRSARSRCERGAGQAALDALDLQRQLLDEGLTVALYPEGTRSTDGRLYKGRTGVAFLALQTGAPVVPVGLIGTDKVMPVGAKVPRSRSASRSASANRSISRRTVPPRAVAHAASPPTRSWPRSMPSPARSSRAPTTRSPRADAIEKIKQALPHERR